MIVWASLGGGAGDAIGYAAIDKGGSVQRTSPVSSDAVVYPHWLPLDSCKLPSVVTTPTYGYVMDKRRRHLLSVVMCCWWSLTVVTGSLDLVGDANR